MTQTRPAQQSHTKARAHPKTATQPTTESAADTPANTTAGEGADVRSSADTAEVEVVRQPAGMDLPLVGHVGYRSLGLYGGLAVAGMVGVVEWPVVAAVGAAYAFARR